MSGENEVMEVAEVVEVQDEQVNEIDEFQFAFDEFIEASMQWQTAIDKLKEFLMIERTDDVAVKIKEQCIYRMTKLYAAEREFGSILTILQSNNSFFATIPKAKTAKIVRSVLDIVAQAPDSLSTQVQLCRDVIQWCTAEKRTFLRQRIEAKLAHLLLVQHEPQAALQMINTLLSELKKLDDKQMLTEVHLTESRIHHALKNFPKAKASLTASRTAAHAIYVSPLLQAELDEMSGMLHCEEGDNTTAYSYFLEGFEAYDQGNDLRAVTCLQYMILSKILSNLSADVPSLLSHKSALKYSGSALQAMAAIAKSAQSRSLESFEQAVTQYETYLRSDHLISHHLDKLYDSMLEINLLKILHPYSCVEISFVAEKIKLPVSDVERKLSQMILDHTVSGTLDQGRGCLIIYDESFADTNYTRGLAIISNMGSVVDALSDRAKTKSRAVVAPVAPAAASASTSVAATK